jgi:hypothetical protein
LLHRNAELPAVERVEIYADMYLWRLVDALREDYPKVVRCAVARGVASLDETLTV